MVGIVLVAHSAALTRAVEELARQMLRKPVPMVSAGGIDDPEHPFGTDPLAIQGAIEKVYSEDGVLVLMDMGSAVLSALTALDLLSGEMRANVLLCEAPLVEGAVSAAVRSESGGSLQEVLREARGSLGPKNEQLGVEQKTAAPEDKEERSVAAAPGSSAGNAAGKTAGTAPGTAAGPPETAHSAQSVRIPVKNRLGIHARPAARLVSTASGFESDITIRNPDRNTGPVSARSINLVSTLGIRGGDHIEITARGPDAGQALQTLAALVETGFGELETEEAVQSGRNRVEDRGDAQTPDLENGTGSGPSGQLRGIPASPGIAAGPVRFYRPAVDPATGSSEGSRRKAGKPKTETPVPVKAPPQEELRRLQAAVEKTARRLSSVRRSSVSAAGTTAAGLIETQLLSLRDPALLERAEQAVLNGSKRAPEAWADAVDRMAASYRELDTPYLAARAGDLESLKNQVLFHLAGREQVRFELNEPSILVADDLGPADLALVDLDKVSGICTVFGGPTSHGAILARSAGIPAVVGLGPGILRIPEKTILAVDGAEGTVLADPSDLQRIQEQCGTWKNARKRALEETREPAVTRDGTRITIEANLGGVQEARYTAQAGADGVGVLRTEFLFLDRSQPPPEEELVETYLAIARVLEGRPMTVRLLDAGGDKPVPYLDMEPEANPFLGVRGVRLLPANRGLFETQIRAVLRAGYEHRVRLLVPMVSSVAEIRAVKEMISAQRWHLRAQGAGCAEYIDVGAMIEVPSAALDAERLSSEADFLSIGTNDLAQYVMAAERGNAHVSVLCDALHPPLLRLVRETAAAGFRAGVPVAVCGEIAGDPGAAVLLLGLGIRELSMNPASIPEVKRTLSRVDVKDAERFAALVVEMDSADQVRSAAGEMLSTM